MKQTIDDRDGRDHGRDWWNGGIMTYPLMILSQVFDPERICKIASVCPFVHLTGVRWLVINYETKDIHSIINLVAPTELSPPTHNPPPPPPG